MTLTASAPLPAGDEPASAPPSHVLYLHGFRSSPQSFKAQRLQAWLQAHRPGVHWWCPQLPPSPREAMALVDQGLQAWPAARMAVLGSSLGGYYATGVAQRLGCPGVLINPAVDPARDLAAYIGEQTAWHDPAQRFFFRPEFVDELRALHAGALRHPQRLLLVAATGDELLSWREMVARYPGAQHHIVQGSDHALSDFDSHLPHILSFLKLS